MTQLVQKKKKLKIDLSNTYKPDMSINILISVQQAIHLSLLLIIDTHYKRIDF